MECRADHGLGIGVMIVELFGTQRRCSQYLFITQSNSIRQNSRLEITLLLLLSYIRGGCFKDQGSPLPMLSNLIHYQVTRPSQRTTTKLAVVSPLSSSGSRSPIPRPRPSALVQTLRQSNTSSVRARVCSGRVRIPWLLVRRMCRLWGAVSGLALKSQRAWWWANMGKFGPRGRWLVVWLWPERVLVSSCR